MTRKLHGIDWLNVCSCPDPRHDDDCKAPAACGPTVAARIAAHPTCGACNALRLRGEHWREARQHSGLTRRQASNLLQREVEDIELGRISVLTRDEYRLASETYGVSVCWLRGHRTELSDAFMKALMGSRRVYVKDLRAIERLAIRTASCGDCTARAERRIQRGFAP